MTCAPISASVPGTSLESLKITIRAYGRYHEFLLPGPKGKGKGRIQWNANARTSNENLKPSVEFFSPLQEPLNAYDIRVENCDHRLTLYVDGEEISEVIFDGEWSHKEATLTRNGSEGPAHLSDCQVFVDVEGEGLQFKSLSFYQRHSLC